MSNTKLRLPEDSMEGNLDKLGYDDDLLGTTPEVQPMKETIDKLNFTKKKKKKKKLSRDFPGGPVAKTLFSKCRGLGSISVQGPISHMLQLRVLIPQLKTSPHATTETWCSQINK